MDLVIQEVIPLKNKDVGMIVCLVGVSGSGKDTIKRELEFPFVVSNRTRPKREGEVDGVDGYFKTVDDYYRDANEGRIIAETIYDGHYYWITEENLAPFFNGEVLVYVVDWNGVKTLKAALHEYEDRIITIAIDVPVIQLIKRFYRDWETDRKSTRLNSSHRSLSRMPSSA